MSQPFAPVKSAQQITVGGITINYTANAYAGNKPTLILIHGFGASLETWSDIYPLLENNFPVVRLDLKGSGFSSKPHDNNYSPTDQAKLLRLFLVALGKTEVVLIGHSLGGGISLLTYFDSVESPGAFCVKGIILIDSAGYSQNLPFFVAAMKNSVGRFFLNLIPSAVKTRFVLKKIIFAKECITAQRVYRYSFFLNNSDVKYALRATAEQIQPVNISEVSRQISRISVPTLILWGRNDPVIPIDYGVRFRKDILNSALVILEKTGHIPHEERPHETFREISDFLKILE